MNVNNFYKELDELFRTGDIHQAEEYMIRCLETAKAEQDVPAILAVCNELGGVYRVINRFAEGRTIYALALEAIKILGLENTLQHGTTLMNLASLHTEERNRQEALAAYKQVEDIYRSQGLGKDYRMAALFNNISHVYDLIGDIPKALEYAEKSLEIILPLQDYPVETATTYTTLALRQMKVGMHREAGENLKKAEAIFRRLPGREDVHYSATLNAMGELSYYHGNRADAAGYFKRAMEIIKANYGESQAYQEVKRNLEKATEPGAGGGKTSGMAMARELYQQKGKPMLLSRFPEYEKYMAVGLVGEGSECFGFDDEYSRDHDFQPGFCIWLPEEIHQKIGTSLQEAYNRMAGEAQMPGSLMTETGNGRRGVFSIGEFYRRYIGTPGVPKDNVEWLMASESGLATATNGEIFTDHFGEFAAVRKRLLEFYPEDVYLKKLTARLAAMSQSGQYNYLRSMKRGDSAAACIAAAEFIKGAAGTFYLLRKTYMPFYKWMFRGMESLEGGREMAAVLARLARIPDEPERAEEKSRRIEEICILIREELNRMGLSASREDFLVAHGQELMSKIRDPKIRSLPMLFDGKG